MPAASPKSVQFKVKLYKMGEFCCNIVANFVKGLCCTEVPSIFSVGTVRVYMLQHSLSDETSVYFSKLQLIHSSCRMELLTGIPCSVGQPELVFNSFFESV